MRKPVVIASLMCAAVLLTGCSSGPKAAEVGEPLEVTVRSSDISAKAEVTVKDITSVPASTMQEELQLPDAYSGGTVFLVHYDAQIVDGDFPSDDTFGFGHNNWQARGADDVEIATVQLFTQPELDDCELYTTTTSGMAAKLAEGSQISACSVFASTDPEAKLESVVYGQKSVSRRGSGKGWEWTAGS